LSSSYIVSKGKIKNIQRMTKIIQKRFEFNPILNLTSIENINLPLKSRDELPSILAGLQNIFVTPYDKIAHHSWNIGEICSIFD
jgi:hypothetical protein